jgi:CMP-2-keto-3-deoxyoctulosonic acid synthetase
VDTGEPIGAVVARRESSRLLGKGPADAGGRQVIERVMERLAGGPAGRGSASARIVSMGLNRDSCAAVQA